MANTRIALKKSPTPGSIPAAGNLANGELAINYADGIIYYKNVTGQVAQISSGRYFGTVNANGTLLTASIPGDIVSVLAGQNITISTDSIYNRLTINSDTSPANGRANIVAVAGNNYANFVGSSVNNYTTATYATIANSQSLSANVNVLAACTVSRLANTTGTTFGGNLTIAGNATVIGSISPTAAIGSVDNGVLRIINPGGASNNQTTLGVTGAIKIRLPVIANNNNTFMRMRVQIFDYAGGNGAGTSRSLEIGGYNFGGGDAWINTFAIQQTLGGGNINVRFGTDGVSDCIWIGETNTQWNYPKVSVTEFMAGGNSATLATFDDGWDVSFVTSFDTVEHTISVIALIANVNTLAACTATRFANTSGATFGGNLIVGGNTSVLGSVSSTAAIGGVDNGLLRIINPGGASNNQLVATITGAIKIRLPPGANNSLTMMRMRVQIYDYVDFGGQTRSLEISGYNFSGYWTRVHATQQTQYGGNITVRYGNDTVSECIWIGEANTTWSYPKVAVTEFMGGQVNATMPIFGSGWNVSFETAFDSVDTSTVAVSLPANNISLSANVNTLAAAVVANNVSQGANIAVLASTFVSANANAISLSSNVNTLASSFVANSQSLAAYAATVGSSANSYAAATFIGSSGSITGYAGSLLRVDNRVISPSEDANSQLKFGFTSWDNNNAGPFADFLHLRSYSDKTGGNENLVVFRKDQIGMRIWQQTFSNTNAYSTYEDVAFTSSVTANNISLSTNVNTLAASFVSNSETLSANVSVLARDAYLKSGGTISGDVAITGNLTISGNTSYVNTQTLLIGDNILVLNADLPGNITPLENAGIEVNRGDKSGNAQFLWIEAANAWGFTGNSNAAITTYVVSNTTFDSSNTATNLRIDNLVSSTTTNNQTLSANVNTLAATFVSANANAVSLSTNVAILAACTVGRLANTSGVSFNGNLIFPTGSIGIGTSTPAQRLHVQGSVLSNNLWMPANTSFSGMTPSITQAAYGGGSIALADGVNGDFLAFNPPTTTETYDANTTTWTTVTTPTYLFRGTLSGANYAVPASVAAVRFTWNNFGYRLFHTLVSNYSSTGNFFKFIVESSIDGTTWTTHGIGGPVTGWPGYLFLSLQTNTQPTTQYFRITVERTNDNGNIAYITSLQLLGTYPQNHTRLFTWDEFRNVSFANTINVAGAANISSPTLLVAGQNVLSTIYTIGAASNTWANSINTFSTSTYVRLTAPSQNVTGDVFFQTGNVAIGASSATFNSVACRLYVNGAFAANTKSFVIDHPTKPGMKLRYGSLEGPENGVYVRGRLDGTRVIELPDYWKGLVDLDSITVNLTAIGSSQNLYVSGIDGLKIYIDSENHTQPHCYYHVYAERKDVEKLVVEF